MVQRFDSEAMERKVEDALKLNRTRNDCEREAGHTRKERMKVDWVFEGKLTRVLKYMKL
jgi:hypothetical protein